VLEAHRRVDRGSGTRVSRAHDVKRVGVLGAHRCVYCGSGARVSRAHGARREWVLEAHRIRQGLVQAPASQLLYRRVELITQMKKCESETRARHFRDLCIRELLARTCSELGEKGDPTARRPHRWAANTEERDRPFKTPRARV
jgi:hypothetical protein